MRTKVGVLGSGIVGQVLGGGFAKHGHQVMMGTRDPKAEGVRNWVAKTTNASAGTFAEAAQFGDVVVLAVLGRVLEEVIKLAGPASFKGKTVVDTTNPLADAPPVSGVLQFTTGPNESLGERVQTLLPEANVVKAFNSVGNSRMVKRNLSKACRPCFCVATLRRPRRKLRKSSAGSDGSLSTAVGSLPPGRSSPSACFGTYQGS